MRKWLLIILFVLAAVFYFFYLHETPEGIKVGDAAPTFSLADRSGNVIALDSYRGKTVLVHFWATWCPSCLGEMPSLERLSERFKESDLVILAVSLDEKGWETVDRFTERVSVTFPVLLDSQGKTAYDYGTYRLPETYLVNPSGVVISKFIGPQSWENPEVLDRISLLVRSRGKI